jgi:hypothetical protein
MKKVQDNKKIRTAPRNQTQEEKVYFYLPLEVLSRIIEFSVLQSFHFFKLVSKEMKKEQNEKNIKFQKVRRLLPGFHLLEIKIHII